VMIGERGRGVLIAIGFNPIRHDVCAAILNAAVPAVRSISRDLVEVRPGSTGAACCRRSCGDGTWSRQ
jgi:hypothetical protein